MKRILVSALVSLILAAPAYAVDKVYSPYVEKGEWEAEYFGTRSFDGDNAKDNAQKHELSFGYGVTEYWKTEIYGIFEKEPQDSVGFDAWEWENIFQFTPRGEYWLDVGGALAFEWTPQSNHANALEARLLLAKDIGKTSHVLNLIAEKEVGSGPRDELEGGFIWSSRYRHSRQFQPGFEISSDFGELEHTGSFDSQEHYLGPVAYGKLPIVGKGIGYRAGYLFGLSDSAADGQLVMQLEYEFKF